MSDWHAILINGGELATRGFVSGFLTDRFADSSQAMLGKDVGVKPESLGDRILELVTGGRHQLVLVTEAFAAALCDALERGGSSVGLVMAEHHRVSGASFDFSVETFSREVGRQVHEILAAIPVGVTVVDRNEEAEVHPDEKGVELYTPGHEYTYRARGSVMGEVGGVAGVRHRLAEIEAVVLGGLHLEMAP